MKGPDVCILIVTWNGKDILKKCLGSLIRSTDYTNYRIVIVDNGSIDGTFEYVKQNFQDSDVYRIEKNQGYAKACNKGLDYVIIKYNPKYIVTSNNDIEFIQKEWLSKLVENAESDKKIGAASPKLLYPDGTIQSAWTIIDPKPWKFFINNYGRKKQDTEEFSVIKEVDFLTGACSLFSTEAINKVGLLDENYAPGWLEDTDYCFKLKKAGFKLLYNGTSKVIHYESMSTIKREPENEESFFIKRRNMFYFLFKYFHIFDVIPQAIMLLLDSVFSMTFLRVRGKAHLKLLLTIKALKEAKSLVQIRQQKFNKL